MDIQEAITSITSSIGNGVSWITEKIIKWISTYSIKITSTQAKVLSLLILGLSIYVAWGISNKFRPLLKWSLVVVLFLLLISVGISIFT